MEFKRYAVYYTPAPGLLADFGAGWLGWDAANGDIPPAPDVPDLPLPRDEITETPRKYGLHATIKPPFRLADGQSPEALASALARFCTQAGPVALDGLEIAQLGRFLALVPQGDTARLGGLAAVAVDSLDAFRAPPTEAELARRRAGGLSAAQDALLERWGYPYVMQEFRFHITLTGKLPKSQAAQVRDALAPHLAPLLPRPFVIDALSLVGEDTDGLFHLIHRYTLSG
jgi:putative phosphonate metabolism protein